MNPPDVEVAGQCARVERKRAFSLGKRVGRLAVDSPGGLRRCHGRRREHEHRGGGLHVPEAT